MRHLAISTLLCAAAGAQVTTPPGLASTEGNMVFFHWGGSRRFQQIEASHMGAPMVITQIAWRRNGNVSQSAPARKALLDYDPQLTLAPESVPGTITATLTETAVKERQTFAIQQNIVHTLRAVHLLLAARREAPPHVERARAQTLDALVRP